MLRAAHLGEPVFGLPISLDLLGIPFERLPGSRLAAKTSVPIPFQASPVPDPAGSRSLFLPVVDIGRISQNACAAAVFDISDGRVPVFLENHPVFGLITGRPVRI